MYILVAKESSIIAVSKGKLCEFDNHMNLIKTGDQIFSRFFGRFQIFAKLFRQVIYSIKKVSEDSFIISSGSGFFSLDSSDLSLKKIKTPSDFKKCLNIGVVDINGIKNIIYSNYNANLKKSEISIYSAPINALDEFKLIYTFKKNTINHIHSFFQDPNTKDIFFNVGDHCDQVGIWKLNSKTLELKSFLTGLQDYRAVYCWIHNNRYIFATDFPGGDNYLKSINILESEPKIEIIKSLKGPVIYGTETRDSIYFATSAEPKKNLGFLSFIPILPIFQKSYLYQYEKANSKLTCISSAKKDWLNPYLFGFGSFQFPHVENNAKLHVNKVGLKKTISQVSHTQFSSCDIYEL